MKLDTTFVEKPWGQHALPKAFGGKQTEKTGEVWFRPPGGLATQLLVKYLFTSEKLSIQVHPNDRQAKRAGLTGGKEECWYILDAEPDAVLGIGLVKPVSEAKLRAAIAVGQAEALIDWKPVKKGDFFYIPAGTIHAIGPGLRLVEMQQNQDVTYRLYDYGRPRELHLDDALSVAHLAPYPDTCHAHIKSNASQLLVDGPYFRAYQIVGGDAAMLNGVTASEWHVVPIKGTAKVREAAIAPGECGLATDREQIDLSGARHALVTCTMI